MMSNTFFYVKNGVLLGYRGYETEISVPETVTRIGDNAFQHSSIIESVIIPETVNRIGFYAFSSCPNLKELNIMGKVKTICKHAFTDCPVLKMVTYHGVKFTAEPGKTSILEVFRMIDTKDFSLQDGWSVSLKYSVLWGMFGNTPDDKEVLAAIKKNFVKMCKYLVDIDDLQMIEKILTESKLVNKRNIESMIKYTIEQNKTEMQVMLTNYKNEKLGYASAEEQTEKIKL